MFNVIDLHLMDSETAIRIFKKKYNEALKKKDKREIKIIHGYGANKFDVNPVIRDKIRDFLSRNKSKLKYRLDLNPGVTYVLPKEILK